MKELILLLIVVAMMGFFLNTPPDIELFANAKLTFAFGFLMIAAYIFGLFFNKIKLPKISGYIIAGIVFGPFVLDYIDAGLISDMRIIDELALTLIALNAGGELKIKELLAQKKNISLMILFQTLFVFVGVILFFFAAHPFFAFLSGLSTNELLAFGMLGGTLLSACSPASAFAIIQELKSKGPFTEAVLGVTVSKDILVIILFGISVSFSTLLTDPNSTFELEFFGAIALQLFLSILAGVGIGAAVSYYLKYIKVNAPVFLLVLAFLIYNVSLGLSGFVKEYLHISIHFEPLLIAITSGFFVQNFSDEGPDFIETIESFSLPIYVLFFAMSGVIVDLNIMMQMISLALAFVVLRLALLSSSSYVAGKMAKAPDNFSKLYGFGFVTQAGVSLGLAGEIMRRFPDWGIGLGTLIIAIINFNQILGPITFKYALQKSGEGRATRLKKKLVTKPAKE